MTHNFLTKDKGRLATFNCSLCGISTSKTEGKLTTLCEFCLTGK